MKLFVLALFAVALDNVLLPLAGWILNWMQEWSQVVFVMAVFPLFMNVIQVCNAWPFARWNLALIVFVQFCLIDSLIKGREGPTDEEGYAYTPAPTQPKDLENASPAHSDTEGTPPARQSRLRGTSHATPSTGDADRGRSRSRDSSRASSRLRGGSRTRQTGSRPLTPLTTPHSPLLNPQALPEDEIDSPPDRGLRVKSEPMRRNRSDGYGSTGSTTPSPVPRALQLSNDDIFPLRSDDIGGSVNAHDETDPDATPRPSGVAHSFPVPPGMSSRIDDRVRIQARRSLSNEGAVPRHGSRWKQHGEGENVVMLNDV